MTQKILNAFGKPISKGQGISLCRFGGLNIIRQKNNYGKSGFHNAPERHGFYAFPFTFVEMFLAASTKQKEIKEGTYKRFNAVEGFLWTHLKPARQADIIDENESWYKVSIEGYVKALKICYANDSAENQFKYGMPNRANPYTFVSRDHLEVFITRQTVIK